jgi:hypothetical protein
MAKEIIGNKNGIDFYVGSDTPEPVRRYTQPEAPPAADLTDLTLPETQTQDQFVASRTGSVDENKIREETRKNMQATIDAINTQYANLVSAQEEKNQGYMGQTRAVNARSGTLGSDFGNANMAGQEKANSQAVKAIRDEQTLKIAEVNTRIDEMATKAIESKRNNAIKDAEAYASYLETQKTDARDIFKTLAASGADLNTLEPKKKAVLLKLAGYDEDTGSLLYNSLKPKKSQIDYKYIQQADGSTLAIGVDPTTGEFIEHTIKGASPDVGVVIDLIGKYGDAGILPTDDLATASKKIQNSRIYKKETYIAPTGGGNADLDRMLKMLEIQTLQGKMTGDTPEAKQDAIKKTDKLQEIVDTASSMLSDKKLGSAVGTLSSKLPTFKGGTADFERSYEKLRGLLTLDNIGVLKGVLSDADMKIIKEASTRLNLNMSESGFKNEFRYYFQRT